MNLKKYKELIDDNEIKFLEEDIKEKFASHSEQPLNSGQIKYILLIDRITKEDTLLTIYNFISTNELNVRIETAKNSGLKITFY